MIVLIWVHHFVTSKTTSFSECQILSINFKWKKKTIYSKIHCGSRGRKVTDWRTIDDHESTDSAVRSEFARVRQILIWNRVVIRVWIACPNRSEGTKSGINAHLWFINYAIIKINRFKLSSSGRFLSTSHLADFDPLFAVSVILFRILNCSYHMIYILFN